MNNQPKHSAVFSNQTRNASAGAGGGLVFYGWLFWFTISAGSSAGMTNQLRTAGSLINQSKN